MSGGARAGFIAGLTSAAPLTVYSAAYMALWPEEVLRRVEEALGPMSPMLPPLVGRFYMVFAAVVVAVFATSLVLGVLLGALYGRLFGAKENKVKAFALSLLYLAALTILVSLPLPLIHYVYIVSSVLYGLTLYLAYVRGFNVELYLREIKAEELRVLSTLKTGRFKLRELASTLSLDVEELYKMLTRLEEKDLVELDLEKRYRLTELGKLVALKASL
ncbi:MAG: hypothetical protein DRJ97_02100 [Thermoprotei archaeon]|nr:MAG: hypothetical protein DRJ97_02100 [Thermoprotei archaeon]